MSAACPEFSPQEQRANAAFDALLKSLARPGMVHQLPEAGETCLIDALIDRECRVYSADPLLLPQIMRCGAEIADAPQADHLFLGRLSSVDMLNSLRLGSDLYPDEGATLIVRAKLGEGAALCLKGPGINGSETVQVSGLPEGFWATRRAVMRYPMGFELILLDADRLMAIPRSTDVEEI
ncbi:phosphonate C-P lyase system protein PhnH [Epibacterium sp. SM1969]|uniref:Phosphonate C-P lyase system protein PhnH n=1 Tax=Tritonibacter aquimaris TaxID=2663379 RepID=A0A844ALA2_9RHOB|nr:phosphonate C-P lyase system protein PhnH [Tritonibacter aquimaris]MQY42535.1 phosphonate C-P lyase system protein PhnH [Tritonibacter aquimaris]